MISCPCRKNRFHLPALPVILGFALLMLLLFLPGGCSHPPGERHQAPGLPGAKASPLPSLKEVVEDDQEDMYARIYGSDALILEGGILRLDLSAKYARAKAMPGDEAKAHYAGLLSRAQSMLDGGKPGEAAVILKECSFIEEEILGSPGPAAASLLKIKERLTLQARGLYQKGAYRDALEPAEGALLCQPSDSGALKFAGELLSRNGEEGLAAAYLQAALAHTPGDPHLKSILRDLLILEGRPREAIPLITPDTGAYSTLGTHWAEMAEAYMVLSRLHPGDASLRDKTLNALGRALKDEKVSERGRAQIRLDTALFRGQFAEALSLLASLNDLTPEEDIKTRLLYCRGLLLILCGKRQEGQDAFRRVISRTRQRRSVTQAESYAALMSAWILDGMGEAPLTLRGAEEIFSLLKSPDHSYRQEFGWIRDYLSARQAGDWSGGAAALKKLTGKRHLEPVGEFVQDILQTPAEKTLVYSAMARMHELAGDRDGAKKAMEAGMDSVFQGIIAPRPGGEGPAGRGKSKNPARERG